MDWIWEASLPLAEVGAELNFTSWTSLEVWPRQPEPWDTGRAVHTKGEYWLTRI